MDRAKLVRVEYFSLILGRRRGKNNRYWSTSELLYAALYWTKHDRPGAQVIMPIVQLTTDTQPCIDNPNNMKQASKDAFRAYHGVLGGFNLKHLHTTPDGQQLRLPVCVERLSLVGFQLAGGGISLPFVKSSLLGTPLSVSYTHLRAHETAS